MRAKSVDLLALIYAIDSKALFIWPDSQDKELEGGHCPRSLCYKYVFDTSQFHVIFDKETEKFHKGRKSIERVSTKMRTCGGRQPYLLAALALKGQTSCFKSMQGCFGLFDTCSCLVRSRRLASGWFFDIVPRSSLKDKADNDSAISNRLDLTRMSITLRTVVYMPRLLCLAGYA